MAEFLHDLVALDARPSAVGELSLSELSDSSGHAEREAECHTNAARRISVIPTSEVTSTSNSITNRPPA